MTSYKEVLQLTQDKGYRVVRRLYFKAHEDGMFLNKKAFRELKARITRYNKQKRNV